MDKLYRINFPDGMEDVFIHSFQNDIRIDGMSCLFTPVDYITESPECKNFAGKRTTIPIVADFNFQSVEQFKPGDKVIFNGASKEQIAWGDNDDPNLVLIKGDTYTVAITEVHSWHTKIWLEEQPGKFNSVSFTLVQ